MKYIFSKGVAMLACIAIFCTSCSKDHDPMIPPAISFKTTAGYTSTDAIVLKNTPVLIGINAAKSEPSDVLTLFTITQANDGGTPSPIYSVNLTGASGDSYTKDTTITTRNVVGTEKYTFTVVNKDRLTNSISITLTVQ